MTTRTARTAWNGSLQDGSGRVELSTSGAGTFDVSFPRRVAEDADGVTSPEELIAAAHSSCFAMQLSGLLGKAGGTVRSADVQADVSVTPDGAGGLVIDSIRLTLSAKVDGVDEETFLATAQQAKDTCPVSKALAGTTITLDASLA
jgi:lipoyl-dependent peroxiredoxin